MQDWPKMLASADIRGVQSRRGAEPRL